MRGMKTLHAAGTGRRCYELTIALPCYKFSLSGRITKNKCCMLNFFCSQCYLMRNLSCRKCVAKRVASRFPRFASLFNAECRRQRNWS